jgi:hypothetical protein
MISKFFHSSGGSGGGLVPPGTYTEGSVLFGAVDGSITENNPLFFWDNTNFKFGLGLNSGLNARLHVRGLGATAATRSFFVESSARELISVYDDSTLVFGGGSASANTIYTFNSFGAVASNNYTLKIIGNGGTDNIFTFGNTNGFTAGGMTIARDSLNNRNALSFLSGGVTYHTISSNGSKHYNTAVPISFIQQLGGLSACGFSSDATYPGLWNQIGNVSTYGFHYTKGTSGGISATLTNFPFFNIYGTFGGLDNGAARTFTFFKLAPTYNYTGTSTATVTGFDYNATVTSLAGGEHYGMLIRPVGALNGFGLASAMPTALLHLAGSTAARASFRIESGTLPVGAAHKDGDFTYDGTDLNFRQSSTTKKIEFQPISQTVNATTATTTVDLSLGNVVILNLQVATTALTISNLKAGTFIIIVKQDGTGGRLMTYTTTMNFAGGVSPLLTATANASDIFSLVYDGTNLRTGVSPNYTI